MYKTKIFIFLILFFFSITIKADKWTDSGNYDITWYSDLMSSFELSTSRQLAGLAYLINNGKSFSGKSIKITANIDMNEHEWEAISTFEGLFDGDFHKISNLHYEYSGYGFSGETQYGFVINNHNVLKNVMLDNVDYHVSSKSSDVFVGGIAVLNTGIISNCIVIGSLLGDYSSSSQFNIYSGGIICKNEGNVENCITIGNVTSKACPNHFGLEAIAGGIVGDNKGNVLNCINRAAVCASVGFNGSWHTGYSGNPYAYAGGIAGKSSGNIDNVANAENVKVEIIPDGNNGYVGAIVASNTGTVNHAYTHSSLIVEGPQVDNTGLLITLSQFQNETYDFTGLLNTNVTALNNSELSYWCNSPEKFNNSPIIIDGFLIDAVNVSVNMNTVSLTASPCEIHSSAITAKGFAIKKAGETEYRHINCQENLMADITDLDFGTDYEVCVFVTTIDGKTTYMRGVSFSTSGISVQTLSATNVTACSATLNGYAPDGIMSVKTQGFRLKEKGTSEYRIVYAGSQYFNATVTNLYPSTNYEYQAFIQTRDDQYLYGETEEFITQALSININIVSPNYRSISLKGSINVDVVADIVIEYRESTETTYRSVTVKSDEYGKFEKTLLNLTPGTNYNFLATVTHIFGNRQHTASTEMGTCKTYDLSVHTLTPIIDSQILLRGEVDNGISTATVGFEMTLNTDIPSETKTYLSTLNGSSFMANPDDVENGKEYKYRAFYNEGNYTAYGSWVVFLVNLDASEREAYAVLNESISTLTFYYDENINSREGYIYKIEDDYFFKDFNDSKLPEWANITIPINKVVFDESFNLYHPKSTAGWFFRWDNQLEEIIGIENLNTDQVVDMGGMFANCNRLASVNLKHFNTEKVCNMAKMFYACESLTAIDVSTFNTSLVTDMNSMFFSCEGIEALDVSNFDTSNVEDMNWMFGGSSKLKSLDLKNFNTAKVKNMSDMFCECYGLSYLDVTSFNTSNVTNMYDMFRSCRTLTELDVSRFNTSNVTDMSYMFAYCLELEAIDVSSFDVRKVKRMESMFAGCAALCELDLNGFRPDDLEYMSYMFEGCTSVKTIKLSNFYTPKLSGGFCFNSVFKDCKVLEKLDLSMFYTDEIECMNSLFENCEMLESINLSSFNTAKVYDMSFMFSDCKSLQTIDLSNFDTGSAEFMINMFYGCSGLTNLDVSYFNTANVWKMIKMFSGCSGLTSLDVSRFNTTNVWDMSNMFSGCSSLTSLDVSNFNTSNVWDMDYMFSGCSSLTSLDVSNFNTSNVRGMGYMFSGCSGLTSLNVSGFNTSNVEYITCMFKGCSGLTSLDLSGFETSNVTDLSNMFSGCSSLTSLDVSGFDTSNVTDMNDMFRNCSGLTSLDVSRFNTTNVTDMGRMFSGCSSLTTIYADEAKWSTANLFFFRHDIFDGCTSLVGGNGTVYDSNHTDAEYARIDKPGQPGYFTYKSSGVVTAIPTLMDNDNSELDQNIYSLSGHRLTAPRKGVNIVGGKKVVIK